MTDEQINELANDLDAGFRCFVHKKDNTILSVPEIDEYSDNFDLVAKLLDEVNDVKKFVEIEKMGSRESFQIMENFIETVQDFRLRDRLETALIKPKPFSNFKFTIDQSGPFRQKWFDFKKQRMIEWVKEQLTINNL